MAIKKCLCCGEDFNGYANRKYCDKCRYQRQLEWQREYRRRQFAENREKTLEYQRRYYRDHIEAARAYYREYKKRRRQKLKE